MANGPGRPEYTDEQYSVWLEAMRPFLENSNSLYYSMEQAGLIPHQTTIYEKYRLKDWFSQKVDAYRRTPGEIANNAIVTLVRRTQDKVKRGEVITSDEQKMLQFYAEKSRSAQPWFVNRQETAQGPSVDEIVDQLDRQGPVNDTINDVKSEASKQMVETQPPLQDQEQTGPGGDVHPEPDAGQIPG